MNRFVNFLVLALLEINREIVIPVVTIALGVYLGLRAAGLTQ